MNDAPFDAPLHRSAALARNWWAILLRGIAAVLFGVVALLLPAQALAVLALLFGVYLLVDGAFALTAALRAVTHHDRWAWLLLEGAVDLVVGLLALVAPGAVILGTVWVISAWAIITGALMLAAAFRLHGSHGNWLLGLGGVISVVWGGMLWVAPGIGAFILTIWLGAYAVLFGIAMIALALRLRHRHIVAGG